MKENGYVETQCARSSCKKPVYGSYWIGFDHQKGYEQRVFCSKECLKSWTIGKLVGMCVAVFLGFALMNAFLQEGNPEMAAIIAWRSGTAAGTPAGAAYAAAGVSSAGAPEGFFSKSLQTLLMMVLRIIMQIKPKKTVPRPIRTTNVLLGIGRFLL